MVSPFSFQRPPTAHTRKLQYLTMANSILHTQCGLSTASPLHLFSFPALFPAPISSARSVPLPAVLSSVPSHPAGSNSMLCFWVTTCLSPL